MRKKLAQDYALNLGLEDMKFCEMRYSIIISEEIK